MDEVAVEIRQVRCFLAVVDHGTFARAAQELFLAQSSVSEQVARLERELGTTLFDRSARRVRLTRMGAEFEPAARELLAAEARARAVARPDTTRPWRVALGAGDARSVHRAVRELRRRSGVEVEVVDVPPQDRVDQVLDGRLDAALVHGPVAPRNGVRRLPLPPESLVAVVGADHPLAKRARVAPGELSGYPLVHSAGARRSAALAAVVRACGPVLDLREIEGSVTTSVAASTERWSYFYASRRDELTALGLTVLTLRPRVAITAALVAAAVDGPVTELHALLDRPAE